MSYVICIASINDFDLPQKLKHFKIDAEIIAIFDANTNNVFVKDNYKLFLLLLNAKCTSEKIKKSNIVII